MSENYVNRVVDQESNIYGIQDYRLPIPEAEDENKVVSIYEGQYALRELDMSNYYNKDQTDGLLAAKANANEVYAKDEVYTKADVYTKNEVNAELAEKVDIVALDDFYTKKDTDIILDDRGFILCDNDVDILDLLVKENVGKSIKFIGNNSSTYKFGHFYQIIPARYSKTNNWNVLNEAFEADRESLQSTSNKSTELPIEVIGRGRIDIKQTSSLTAPVEGSINNIGLNAENNPRIQTSERTTIGGNPDWVGGDLYNGTNYDSNSSYKRCDISPSHNTVSVYLNSRSTWAGIANENIDRTLEYNNSDGHAGVIYGLTVNRCDNPIPTDRSNLDNLTTNIHGSHFLKVDPDSDATLRAKIQLFGYMVCNNAVNVIVLGNRARWSGGDTTNKIFGSIWLKYTDVNGNLQQVKIPAEASGSVDIEAPQSEQEATYSNNDNIKVFDPVNIDYVLPEAMVDESGYKTYEIIEVLEAYQPQKGDVSGTTAVNGTHLLAWGAFTDLSVLTLAGAEITEVYTENPFNNDNIELNNSNEHSSIFSNELDTSLVGASLVNITIQDLTLDGDSDIINEWKGLASRDGITSMVYTDSQDRRIYITPIITDDGTIDLEIKNSGSLVSIDSVQTIQVRRLI